MIEAAPVDSEVAKLHVVNYADLLSSKPQALATLLTAAKDDGFFYLNLNDSPGKKILQSASSLVATSKRLFQLPLSEKMLFDTNRLGTLKNYGYKPMGRNTGISEGKQDGHEIFLIPRDVLLGRDSRVEVLSWPNSLDDKVPLLEKFSHESHEICSKLLESLFFETGRGCFTAQHPGDQPSTSAAALIKYPRSGADPDQAGHIAHTDVGSLTLLFCDQGGLQILPPTTRKWKHVIPIPGHAVVNIGDSLRHLSDREFRSCLHRVLPCTGNEPGDRYSIIYFMRPKLDAEFVDEAGNQWSSLGWHVRKFDAFRHSRSQEVEALLRGRF